MTKKWCYKIYPVFSIVLVVFVWWAAARIINVEFLLPTPQKTMTDLLAILKSSEFYISALKTAGNVLFSFTVSFLPAFVLATLSAFCKAVERLMYPLVLMLRVIPTMSVVFLSILWLTSDERPHLIVFLVIFPMLYVNFLSAINGVDGGLKEMAKVYGVSKKDIILHLYIPSVAKASFPECVSILSFAVKLSVSGEVLASSHMTIGFLMKAADARLETGLLIAYTVLTVVMGFLVELICRLIAKLVLKVRYKYAKA